MDMLTLTSALSSVGLRYSVLSDDKGGNLVLLERGARVIGVFTNEHSENQLWVNPDILLTEIARNRFVAEKHWNIGGDRTWVSPEVEYFIRDFKSIWETYTFQGTLDPGCYSLEHDPNQGAIWEQSAEITAFRSLENVKFDIRKTVKMVQDPLNILENIPQNSYSFVGYELGVMLTLKKPNNKAEISIWNLLQVPAGGEVFIPTYGKAEVTDFLQPTGPSHLFIDSGLVRFRIDAKEQHKISLKTTSVTGRLGYFRTTDFGNACLLVREIKINPSGKYLDVPIHNLDDKGHCIQCYNENGNLGNFGEIEYHSPVLSKHVKEVPLMDISQVWFYTGKMEEIEIIRKVLLGY